MMIRKQFLAKQKAKKRTKSMVVNVGKQVFRYNAVSYANGKPYKN